MKTKTVKTIVQPMYKVFISSKVRKAFPSYKIGECYKCTDNWSMCWN